MHDVLPNFSSRRDCTPSCVDIVTVEGRAVHEGGQAIVGNLENRGGGFPPQSKDQPQALANAPLFAYSAWGKEVGQKCKSKRSDSSFRSLVGSKAAPYRSTFAIPPLILHALGRWRESCWGLRPDL